MRVIFAFASLAVLAGCVAPSAPPPAPARPVPVPAPAPAPLPPPPPAASSDWRDWPLTPGGWSYRSESRGSVALFGQAGDPAFTLRCDRSARQLQLTRRGVAAGTMTVRTSSAARSLTAGGATDGASATLPANDSLVDAMGYSRGRFIVETPGAPPLVVPAWSEVLRVLEDCRG
jgi:hypothetical protein